RNLPMATTTFASRVFWWCTEPTGRVRPALSSVLLRAPLDSHDKLSWPHWFEPDFVPGRYVWRHREGIAGQDRRFHAEIGGSINHNKAVTIAKPPVRNNQIIPALGKPLHGSRLSRDEIRRISGGIKNVDQKIIGVTIILDN